MRSFALEAGKAENWPQAIAQIQNAIQVCGSCSNAVRLHKDLAFFYERTWRFNDAEKELQKAIALDANDRDAQNALAMLYSLTNLAPEPK